MRQSVGNPRLTPIAESPSSHWILQKHLGWTDSLQWIKMMPQIRQQVKSNDVSDPGCKSDIC
jgi:hypothetical protein